MTKPNDNSPREIWLSPPCKCNPNKPHLGEGRCWADFEFPPCPTCGAKATRYVRPGLKRREGK